MTLTCRLKIFAASLLHPDSETGRIYWREVYNRARRAFGTSKCPFQSFQKVWILSDKATVLSKERHETDLSRLIGTPIYSWVAEPNSSIGMVLDFHLQAMCEVDVVALRHSENASSFEQRADASESRSDAINQITNDVYRELVLPVIERELNEGKDFAVARQVFSSLVLATWLKKVVRADPDLQRQFSTVLDSNKPKLIRPTIRSLAPLEGSPEATRSRRSVSSAIDHVSPEDPAFKVPENAAFYERYIRLFKEGLYRVARSEQGDASGGTDRQGLLFRCCGLQHVVYISVILLRRPPPAILDPRPCWPQICRACNR